MSSSRTLYPKFANALYELVKVMGEVRTDLFNNAGFSDADKAAFDGLYQVLTGQFALTLNLYTFAVGNTGTAWFPPHTEAA